LSSGPVFYLVDSRRRSWKYPPSRHAPPSSIRTRSSGQNAQDPRLPASDAERQRVSDPPTLALQRRERAR